MFSSFYRPIVLITQPKSYLSHSFGRHLKKHMAIPVAVSVLSLPSLAYSETITINKVTNTDTPSLIVLSSIKPIQLLVQTIAGDLTEQKVIDNQLLLPAGTSPHDYAMRFSDTKKLKQADLVFWIGENLETFLSKPLKLNKKGKVISFNTTLNGNDEYHTRTHRASITRHHHHKNDHGNHSDSQTIQTAHQEPHPWLSPIYAVKMAETISISLSEQLPQHQTQFSENLHRFTQKMVKLEFDFQKSFGHLSSKNTNQGFIVFHDAYSELVSHFKLNQLAVVTPMAGRNPKLRHVLNLKKLVGQGRVSCIITEPNANTKILSKIINAGADKANKEPIGQFIIDPIASNQAVDNNGFYDYFSSVLENFKACIK